MKKLCSESIVVVTMLVATLLTVCPQSTIAGSATWLANPTNGDWNNPANWSAGGPPNSSVDTTSFATTSQPAISLPASVGVSALTYNSGASAYTTTISPALSLVASGVGIANNSGTSQHFVTLVDAAGNAGGAAFFNNATAGSATFFTNNSSKYQ